MAAVKGLGAGAKRKEESKASSPMGGEEEHSSATSDLTPYEWFTFRTADKGLKDKVSTAIAKLRANPTSRCPINFDRLDYLEDGLRCHWKQPRKVQVAWMFFHKRISKIFEPGEEWPHWWITGVPTACMPLHGPPAASGQGVGLPAASSDSAAPSGFERQC